MAIPTEQQGDTAADLERDLAQLMVNSLRLEMTPDRIDPTAPLFGEGLGLDSIDMLEIALAVSKTYGVELRSENRTAFTSLRALAAHIVLHRTR
ncbi:MAG: Phosphopantetheine-binding protein [Nitrospira sp.]|jgi:acyl carrier protein|nr:Phosphopantetheine-binding protein [Nitrospira sp.]